MINAIKFFFGSVSNPDPVSPQSTVSYQTIGAISTAGIVGGVGLIRYYLGYPEVLSEEICTRFHLPFGTPGKYSIVENRQGRVEQLITYRFSLMTLSWKESKALTKITIPLEK